MQESARPWSAALSRQVAAGSAIPAAASPMEHASAATTVTNAATAQALQPWPVLREGRNSLWPLVTVRSLQYLLNARGAHLAVDGAFGSRTKAAVVVFQRSRHLATSGVVTAAINFRNLKNGHTLDVDGIFGLKTEAALRGFQRAMATAADGGD